MSTLNLRKQYYEYLKATDRVDRNMINECVLNYRLDSVDYYGKTCLDLGANIGGFIKIALDGGAEKVIAVECDIRNFTKLDEIFGSNEKVVLIHAAVSNSDEDTIKIYKSNSQQNHCTTTIIKKNIFKKYDEVKNIKVDELIEKYSPEIIKVDIEGAEYQILESIEKHNPSVLFVELHMGKVKQFARPAIDRLTKQYPNHKIDETIVYGGLSSYNCFFKK